jgi:DNA polymerase III subunit beta
MKLVINSTKLADLVARGASSAPKNSPLALANNARIIAKSGKLSIASTDLDRMVEATRCRIRRISPTTTSLAFARRLAPSTAI